MKIIELKIKAKIGHLLVGILEKTVCYQGKSIYNKIVQTRSFSDNAYSNIYGDCYLIVRENII